MEECEVSAQVRMGIDSFCIICTLATIVIGNYDIASQVLQLNGCEFSYTFAFSDATLILGFISLLVAEVFAIGLKMKEEQDLTI